MQVRFFMIFVFVCCMSCKSNKEESIAEETKPAQETGFDSAKWNTRDGNDYPYRKAMLPYLFANDTLKKLNKEELLALLGEPTRTDGKYLFYRISQERVGFFPLHTKTLVINLAENDSVKTVKIHE